MMSKLTIMADGYKEWRLDGKFHREDGPAFEWPNGNKFWYLHGQLHRTDGPAVERPDGTFWYLYGRLHRADGPAVEWPDGRKEYWLNGEMIVTEFEYWTLVRSR